MRIDTNKKKPPPVTLVKTWVYFATKANEPEAQNRALEMLRLKIGNPEQVMNYMRKHNIK